MENNNEILDSLILGGVVGATLGALIAKDKNTGGVLGAIAGAALFATFKANEDARKTNVPVYIKEGDIIYALHSNGEKEFIKRIEPSGKKLPKEFKLK